MALALRTLLPRAAGLILSDPHPVFYIGNKQLCSHTAGHNASSMIFNRHVVGTPTSPQRGEGSKSGHVFTFYERRYVTPLINRGLY